MSDIHTLLTDEAGNVQLIFHIAVPNSNNSVAVNYRTALVRSGLGGTTRLIDGDGTGGTIAAAEKTSVQSGAIYEHLVMFPVATGGSTAPQLQATIRALYATESAKVLAALARQLKYFGHVESQS